MELVTFQTVAAYESLINNGYLIADEKFININKYGTAYDWIVSKMHEKKIPEASKYPLWAWYKCGKFKSPTKNTMLGYFGAEQEQLVKIVFEKTDNEVLLTDYKIYHFLLVNAYLPSSLQDFNAFNKFKEEKGVTDEDLLAYIRRDKYDSYRTDKDFNHVNEIIHKSYEQVLNLSSDYIQACVWNIKLSEVKSVQFIEKNECKKHKSVDYRKEYINSLK